MTRAVSVESMLLAFICLADMLSTLLFISLGMAVEHNPIMAVFIDHSVAAFVAIKLVSFVPFIMVIEWYRTRKPSFALGAARAAIGLYLMLYVALTLQVNIV